MLFLFVDVSKIYFVGCIYVESLYVVHKNTIVRSFNCNLYKKYFFFFVIEYQLCSLACNCNCTQPCTFLIS